MRLYKDQQATRLGIIFHQSTPAELGDVSSDATPRAGDRQPVVLPVIKVRLRVRVGLGLGFGGRAAASLWYYR